MTLKLCFTSQSQIIKYASRQLRIEKEKPGNELKQIFNETNDPISCDYYNIYELNKIQTKERDLCIIHLNISSLSSHIDDLEIFFSLLSNKADIICISESRLSQRNLVTTKLNSLGYNIEYTPTEASAGGTLMHISEKLLQKLQRDLQMYSPMELQSTFIEIIIPNRKSALLCIICKHSSMTAYKFNSDFLELLLTKWQCWQEISTST